ncbi:MAG: hypothetical protein E6J41_32665 [Chloroflexi bacterium]|nr:MAG: hypothetical protein E6J41_32665 [Chloroflexota bacterium]
MAELDHSNPVMVCEVHPTQVLHDTYDGTSGTPLRSVVTYTYDDLGRVASQTTQQGGTLAGDASGHGNLSIYGGGVTQQAAGLVSGDTDLATAFDGSTSYLSMPGAPFGAYPTTGSTTSYALTFEAWFQTTVPGVILGQTDGGLPPAGVGGNVPAVYVDNTGALRESLFWHGAAQSANVAPGPYDDGHPHQVVVTYSGGTESLYVDGALKGSKTGQSETGYASSYSYLLGAGYSNGQWPNVGTGWMYFKGTLDEASVYGTALSAARVQAHFLAAAGSGYKAAVLADSPAAYYRLDDGTGSPNLMVNRPRYVWNDTVTPNLSAGSANGHYLINFQASNYVEDSAGSRHQCSFTSYDGQPVTSGLSANLTVGEATATDRYTDCGGFTGQLRTTSAYDVFGNLTGSADPDANAGVGGHTDVLPTRTANALNQASTTAYGGPGQTSVVDSSGSRRDGSWSGGLTFGAAGALGSDSAASFDGSSGYVTAPAQSISGAISVEAWIDTANPGQNGIIAGANPVNASWELMLETGSLVWRSCAGAGSCTDLRVSPPSAGQWHHVVVTQSGTTATLYVDGVQTGQSSSMAAFASGATDVEIGRYATGYYYLGSMDEVAIYASALPAARVLAHFGAGANYRPAVMADSPRAYYRLDDTGGGTFGGFGLWPISKTDANGQTTATSYDGLGRVTSETEPGESAGLATLGTSYTVWCAATGAQTPCVEVDKTQRLNATTTVTSRGFYDGLGRLVETRTPAPGGQDVVRYTLYNPSPSAGQPNLFQSLPYLVSAYTGPPGSAAYSIPDSSVAGTSTTYDGLGRVLTTTDALPISNTTTRKYSVVCGAPATGDATCYEQTLSIDPNGHQVGTLADSLGRTAFEQRYTGNSSSTYAVYATARYAYDFAGDMVQIVEPDGVTQSTFGYDMAGRKRSASDPDLGSLTYTYDQNGNLIESIDARAAAGTIFMGYDGLNRPTARSTNNDLSSPYDTYTYDSTAAGNVGIGRLTSETFSSGSLSGSYAYTYDGRGQQTQSTLTVGGASYPLGSSYDDAGNVLAQTYPDGETITNSYTAQGWLSGVSTSLGATTLASNLAYTSQGGAFGEITGASLGNAMYTYNATYDALDRATDLKTTKTSGGTVMFDQTRTFDGVGNAKTITTAMPGATDNQSFCYDEQDRLTWASAATVTPPCGGSNTAGTLTAAQYTQTFGYDVMGRLTSGPLGTYTYGSGAHVHAATGIGTTWTAAYDAAGNMTCRAPSSSTTCSGTTQTGARLGYNNEGELQSWQNPPSSPTTTAQFLYDGQGQRVEQSVTQAGTTTTTVYVGDVEEVSTTGGTTTTTAYYYMDGKRIGLSVNGVTSYLASDALGSATVTLSSSGAAMAAQLFLPYGNLRYSSGSMPTSYGFTGQRSDTASGLDYYGARYYDPLAGQFTSADSVLPGGGFDLWGLSRYAYVEGDPEDRTDPSGHINQMMDDDGSAAPIDNAFQGSYLWGTAPITHHRAWTRPYRPRPAPVRSSYRPRGGDPERNSPGSAPAPATGSGQKAAPPPIPVSAGLVLPLPVAAAPGLPGLADLPLIGECLALAPICGAAIGVGLALTPSDVGGDAADDPSAYLQEHSNISLAKDRKKLTNGEIKRLKQGGVDPEQLKDDVGGGGQQDLFKDRKGNIYIHPKDGSGPGDATGLNINDF